MGMTILQAIGSITIMLTILSGPFIALAAVKIHDIAKKEGLL